jgi:hypothetical protein
MQHKAMNKNDIHYKTHNHIRTSIMHALYPYRWFSKIFSIIQKNWFSRINTYSSSHFIHSRAGNELHQLRILILMKIYFHLGTTLEENFKKKQKNVHVLQNNVKFLNRELVTSHHSIVQSV